MSRPVELRSRQLLGTTYLPNGMTTEFAYTPSRADQSYMYEAVDLARRAFEAGDSPIGAVLVHPDEGAFSAQTAEFRDNDLLGHAEMRAYSLAREKVGRDLGRCMLYTTAEPCFGCAYILDKGAIGILHVAASREDAPDFFRRRDTLHTVWSGSRRTLTIVRGLMRKEAAELLTADSKRH